MNIMSFLEKCRARLPEGTVVLNQKQLITLMAEMVPLDKEALRILGQCTSQKEVFSKYKEIGNGSIVYGYTLHLIDTEDPIYTLDEMMFKEEK